MGAKNVVLDGILTGDYRSASTAALDASHAKIGPSVTSANLALSWILGIAGVTVELLM